MNYKTKMLRFLISSLILSLLLSQGYGYSQQENRLQLISKSSELPTKESFVLNLSEEVEKQIKGGETHSYSITAKASNYLEIVVEQKGIDIVVALLSPSNEVVKLINIQQWKFGKEFLSALFTTEGNYTIQVKTSDKNALLGKYRIKVQGFREVTQKDKDLLEAETLFNEANKIRSTKPNDALLLAQKVVEVRESFLEAKHSDIASAYHLLGIIYRAKVDLLNSEKFLLKALEIRKETLGLEHPDTASTYYSLGNVYVDQAKYDTAEHFYKEALAIREKTLGIEHIAIAETYNGLGLVYKNKDDYKVAEEYYKKALNIIEKIQEPPTSILVAILDNLATLYINKKQYDNVETLYKRTLELLRMTPKSEVAISNVMQNLANLYRDLGDYKKAESYYKEALEARKKFAPQSRDVASTLNNIVRLYTIIGEYEKAEPLCKEAIEINEKLLGRNHRETITVINNLAILYFSKGDYEKAETFWKEVLEARKKIDPQNNDTAEILNNLGVLNQHRNKYEEAEAYFNDALKIRQKIFGNEDTRTASVENNLGLLNHIKKEYGKSEAFHKRALVTREKLLPPDHLTLAESFNNLAFLYKDKAEYEKSEEYYLKALKIYERKVGIQHRNTALILSNISKLYQAKGDIDNSLIYRFRANEANEQDLENNLLTGSEKQKLAYLKISESEKDTTISLHSQLAPTNEQAAKMALTAIFRRKGRILDAMASTIAFVRKEANKEDQELLSELSQTYKELAETTLKDGSVEENKKVLDKIKELNNKLENLQNQLSSKKTGIRTNIFRITLDKIQQAIPSNTVLIEFSSYQPYNAKTGDYGELRYIAYTLNNQGEIHFVDLGKAKIIDTAVREFRQAVIRKPNKPLSDIELEVKPKARAIDKLVMEPVRKLIPGLKHLLISPDRQLTIVPFDAFVDEQGKYLVENYEISYLTSGRDLLRLQTKIENKQPPIVVTTPDYGDGINSILKVHLQKLLGKDKEADTIKELFPSCQLYRGKDATKKIVQDVNQPEIIHIVTHAYFLEDTLFSDSTNNDTQRVLSEIIKGQELSTIEYQKLKTTNPLLNSGLFFAEANDTEEGIMTALEISSLNLAGTKLVVLSACGTGLGDIKNDEGLYGLKRALVLAGAESQMVSLWEINDAFTSKMMTKYYNLLKINEERGTAIRKVQLSFLKSNNYDQEEKNKSGKKNTSYSHPYYWASFILSGEWGKLELKP